MFKEKEENSNYKHGMTKTRLFEIWAGMKKRCYKKYHTSYKNYGGKGVTMCDEWIDSFINFKDWSYPNGYSDELTIDRIDPMKNYEPSNCRWATKEVQARNVRGLRRNNTTGFKGVTFEHGKYVAKVRVSSKRIYLGRHKTAIEAGLAYNKYITDNCLEHTLNIIDSALRAKELESA